MRRRTGFLLALGAALAMLLWPQQVMEAAQRGCALWAQAVMPGLLPFLVCLLYATGRMRLKAGRPCPATGLSRTGRSVLLMGLITGSPGGARLMAEAASRGLLTARDGVRLAIYGGAMSPMFLMGTLPLWLQWPQAGLRLLAAHWIGVLCAGEISRLFPAKALPSPQGGLPPPMTLPRAIEGACRALMTVCGAMVMGCVAAQMAQMAFPHLPPLAAALLQCMLEVTAGCQALIAHGAPPWFLAGAVSLGGLSLLLQNMAFYPRGWFHLGWVMLGRGLACLLSLGVGWLLFWGEATPVFSPGPLPLADPSLLWLVAYFVLCLIPLAVRAK